MEHLEIEKIIEFVSMDEFNGESLKLAALVNSHIRRCKECLDKVRAYQMVYDELSKGKKKVVKKTQTTRQVFEDVSRMVAQQPTEHEEFEELK